MVKDVVFNLPVLALVFVSSVSASISLVRAKVGWYVLFLAKVVRECVVCDVGMQADRFAALCNPVYTEREINNNNNNNNNNNDDEVFIERLFCALSA